MGFSYERDVGEMLHSYNHRVEAILARVFNSLDFLAWAYKPGRMPAAIRPDQSLNPIRALHSVRPVGSGKGRSRHGPLCTERGQGL